MVEGMEYYSEEESERLAREEAIDRDRDLKKKRRRSGGFFFVIFLIIFFATGIIILIRYTESDREKDMSAAESVSEDTEGAYYTESEIEAIREEAYEEGRISGENALKDRLRVEITEGGHSINDIVRGLYPEYMVYMEGGSYHFDPVREDVPKNRYRNLKFTVSGDGLLSYIEDGQVLSKQVIDVSYHQGDIDWAQVKEAGVDYCMIRAGYRGYGSGAIMEDECFKKNVEGAVSAGLEVGVYFYTQALNEEEAVEEAQFVMDLIAPYRITLPVAIDVEKPEASDARGNGLDRAQRTAAVKTFCDSVAAAGYEPMIYGGTVTFAQMLEADTVKDYSVWYAFYNDYLYYPYELKFWQYSMSGTVPGIKGKVDMSLWLP